MVDNPRGQRADAADLDVVDVASEESFPASDPPGWAIGQEYPAEVEIVPPPPEPGASAEGGSLGDHSVSPDRDGPG